MRQQYGQHFLIDLAVITHIVDAALILYARCGAQRMVEIGPGRGALTQPLLARGVANFTAIEIDPNMEQVLRRTLPADGWTLLRQDFLQTDLTAFPAEKTLFVSNLPYESAVPILDKVLAWQHTAGAVCMFQKEHALKIRARAGEDFYGPLSIFSQLRARISPVCKVGCGCFNPPPKVESAVLAFEPLAAPPVPWEQLRRVVLGAFAHKRKTAFNSLALSGFDKTCLSHAFASCAILPSARAEQLTPESYVTLTRSLFTAP